MKPRSRFEMAVAASNMKLSAISPKAVEWAVRNTVSHIAFRTSGHKCTCGDCGRKFDYKGKGKHIRCPHCRHKLEVTDTLMRKAKECAYFFTIERVDSFHVQRVFLLTAVTSKGKKLDAWHREVCRLLFSDAVHFTLSAFVCNAWSREMIYLKTAAGRNRLNVLGAADAVTK